MHALKPTSCACFQRSRYRSSGGVLARMGGHLEPVNLKLRNLKNTTKQRVVVTKKKHWKKGALCACKWHTCSFETETLQHRSGPKTLPAHNPNVPMKCSLFKSLKSALLKQFQNAKISQDKGTFPGSAICYDYCQHASNLLSACIDGKGQSLLPEFMT
eukprot:1162057-Pelagomonas_calceolata.AAC.1